MAELQDTVVVTSNGVFMDPDELGSLIRKAFYAGVIEEHHNPTPTK